MHAIFDMATTAATDDLRIGTLDGASLVRERRTTQELVFEFLRDAILSGRLRGGADPYAYGVAVGY